MNTRQPGDWLPLSKFCRNHPDVLPDRYQPLRVGQPLGPHRLRFMFGEKRRTRVIEVRARPGYPNARHEQIPLCEWMGFVVDDSQSRLQHEHSGQWYYDAQVRLTVVSIGGPRASTSSKAPRGFCVSDEKLAKKLIKRVDAGVFPSDAAACNASVDKIQGAGTPESLAKRVHRFMKDIRNGVR